MLLTSLFLINDLVVLSFLFLFLFLPKTLSFFWNNSSSLSFLLSLQLVCSVILSIHFTASFNSLIFYVRHAFFGFKLRFFHANGASFFLFFIFLHYFRSAYFLCFNKSHLWASSCVILLLSISGSFLSYVLPYSQMSFWSATVICNLLSVIPVVSDFLKTLLWGTFVVSLYTLKRFFTLHFLVPLIIAGYVLFHILLLHLSASNSSFLGVKKKSFFKLFFVNDCVTWVFWFFVFCFLCHICINLLSDVENFLEADALNTPLHIKPEWYFLFAYSILRCIPNNTLSVLSLFCSVLLPITFFVFCSNSSFSHLSLFLSGFFILTVTSACVIECPYVLSAQIFSFSFFGGFLL